MVSDAETVLAMSQAEPAAALEAARAARAAAERSGEDKARAAAMIQAGDALSLLGQAQDAMTEATEALDLCEELRFDAGRGAALALVARICAAHGGGEDDAELGLDSAQDALRVFKKMGLKKGQAVAQWSAAKAEAAFGRPQEAVRCAKEAMALFQELGEGAAEASAAEALADAFLALRDPRRAAQAAARAATIQGALGNKKKEAQYFHKLANIEIQRDEPEKAAAAMAKARGLFKEARDFAGEAAVLGTEKEMRLGAGNFAEAVRAAKETVSLYHGAGDKVEEGRALLRLAELLLENNDVAKSYKVAEVAMGVLSQAQNRDALVEGMELMGAIKHASVKQEMMQVIEMNSDFMHVPKSLIVDPGFNKRIQESYQEAGRKGLF